MNQEEENSLISQFLFLCIGFRAVQLRRLRFRHFPPTQGSEKLTEILGVTSSVKFSQFCYHSHAIVTLMVRTCLFNYIRSLIIIDLSTSLSSHKENAFLFFFMTNKFYSMLIFEFCCYNKHQQPFISI
jgi:hypothetical protein